MEADGKNNYIIPDYSFGKYPKVQMILESKYRINNLGRFSEAYTQASKYGLLLGCEVICLAALEGLWIFSRVDDAFREFVHTDWVEIRTEDGFREVERLIGPSAMLQ